MYNFLANLCRQATCIYRDYSKRVALTELVTTRDHFGLFEKP